MKKMSSIENKTINEFVKELTARFDLGTTLLDKSKNLGQLKLLKNECVFIWSLDSGEMSFCTGFKELLGYEDEAMNFDTYTKLFHPDDGYFMHRLAQMAVRHALENPGDPENFHLFVAFRLRKADGDYIKVLSRTSCFETDENGIIKFYLGRLSDIGFADSSEIVHYKFAADHLNHEAFHRLIYKEHINLFSSRELEIIKLMGKEYTNKTIALELEISAHTVATHRKKMMKKGGCHSAEELLLFCKKNGILH